MSGNYAHSENAQQHVAKGDGKFPELEGGQKSTHHHDLLDSKDERTIANRLDKAAQKNVQEKQASDQSIDPTLPARSHGNEPSKGAKIDASLQQEEEEYLEKKGGK